VVCVKKRGDAGEPVAVIHARDDSTAEEAANEVLAASVLADEPPRRRRSSSTRLTDASGGVAFP
jgi:thymidine phosphorylase